MNEFIAIYQPSIVLSAIVDETAEKAQASISFATLTGSYSSVKDGMDIWIGTEYNSRDIARLRIKSIEDGAVELAEHDLTLVSGTYLTAKSIFGLYPVFPTIKYEDEVIVEYKDKDIAYTDDNTDQGIIPIAGAHSAIFAGESVYFDTSGTISLVGNALTYAWDFGDEVGTSTSGTPGNYTYADSGYYTVELAVTDSEGKEQKTYRYVSVLTRDDLPYDSFIREDISGMRTAGGWRTRITLRESTSVITDNDVVVVFSDDSTLPSNNQPNRSKTLMVGYVIEGTILHNWQDASVSFEVGSASYILNRQETYGISLVSTVSGSASQWYQMDDLTLKRGFWEYFKWNTTILSSVDVRMDFTDVSTQYFDTEKTFAWDSIRAICEMSFYGYPCFDRLNTMWIQQHPGRVGSDTDSLPSNLAITKSAWIGMPEINQTPIDPVSYLEVGGMIYSGGTETGLRLAAAPGDVPQYFGSPESIPGLSVASFAELLSITANVFGYMNRQYRSVDFTMAQQQWQSDIAPLRNVPITVGAADTNRGITWSAKAFYAENIDIRRQSDTFRSVFDIELSEFAYGTESEEIILPVPTIPSIPDIPITIISGSFWEPSFPIVPDDPIPNPGPYILVLPTDPQNGCIGDINYPGNGPFNTGIAGTYSTNDAFFPYVGCSPASFFIRTAAHVSKTKYILHAKFEKWNGTAYAETDDDDFYSVVLYQDGEIIDVGDKQSFDDNQFREGTFTGDGSQWANGVGLLLNYNTIAIDSAVLTINAPGSITSSSYDIQPFGEKAAVKFKSIRDFAGTRILSSKLAVDSSAFNDVPVNYDWTIVTDAANRFTVGLSNTAATVYTTGELYYGGHSGYPAFDLNLTGVHNSTTSNLYFGCKMFPNNSILSDVLYLWTTAGYRITVYALNLYNVCMRTSGGASF